MDEKDEPAKHDRGPTIPPPPLTDAEIAEAETAVDRAVDTGKITPTILRALHARERAKGEDPPQQKETKGKSGATKNAKKENPGGDRKKHHHSEPPRPIEEFRLPGPQTVPS
jgi:hypothetical protein